MTLIGQIMTKTALFLSSRVCFRQGLQRMFESLSDGNPQKFSDILWLLTIVENINFFFFKCF